MGRGNAGKLLQVLNPADRFLGIRFGASILILRMF